MSKSVIRLLWERDLEVDIKKDYECSALEKKIFLVHLIRGGHSKDAMFHLLLRWWNKRKSDRVPHFSSCRIQ